MKDDDGQSFSQSSSDTMEEIDSGRGISVMSLGVVNEALSISDDQLHQEWLKAPKPENNFEQFKSSRESASQVTWSWRSDAGSFLGRTVKSFKRFYDWLTQEDKSDFSMIILHRGPNGELGIKLEGGLDKPAIMGDPGIFVKSVLKDGPAEGKLTPGDRIVLVGGVDVSCVCRSHAALIIRKAGDPITLHVKKATSRQQRIYKSSSSSHPFSRQQLDEFEDAFCVFDRRGNGTIRNKNVVKALRSLGYNPPEPQLWFFMSELGIRADKSVSFQDFIQVIYLIIKDQDTERDICQAFSMFDDNDDGLVECMELHRALQRMPGARAVEREEVYDILRLSDPGNTGKIKIKGFEKLLYPTFKLY